MSVCSHELTRCDESIYEKYCHSYFFLVIANNIEVTNRDLHVDCRS